jgi:hypothetical protein
MAVFVGAALAAINVKSKSDHREGLRTNKRKVEGNKRLKLSTICLSLPFSKIFPVVLRDTLLILKIVSPASGLLQPTPTPMPLAATPVIP